MACSSSSRDLAPGRGLQRRRRGAVRAHRDRRLHARPRRSGRRARGRPGEAVRAGVGAVALIVVLGNLDGARGADRRRRAAARVRLVRAVARDPGAITEFPWFSFLLGDLHAHVLALPFTLLAVAFALQVVLDGPRLAPRGRAVAEARRRRSRSASSTRSTPGRIPSLRACWRWPWSAGCATAGAARRGRRGPLAAGGDRAERRARAAVPPLLRPRRARDRRRERGAAFAGWLRDQALLFGSLAVFVALAYLGRLAVTRAADAQRGVDRRRRRVRGLAAGAPTSRTSALLAVAARRGAVAPVAPGTPRRARSWLLLAAGWRACSARSSLRARRVRRRCAVPHEHRLQARLPGVDAPRPGAAARSPWWRRGCRAGRRPLRGRRRGRALAARASTRRGHVRAQGRLRPRADARRPRLAARRAPGRLEAIAWLNDHAPADAVVLETVGEDYSRVGHARISTFTGLPTVLGWPGHELQWGHDPGTRRADVATLYETTAARRGSCSTATASTTSSSARSSAPTMARGRGEVGPARRARASTSGDTTVWKIG